MCRVERTANMFTSMSLCRQVNSVHVTSPRGNGLIWLYYFGGELEWNVNTVLSRCKTFTLGRTCQICLLMLFCSLPTESNLIKRNLIKHFSSSTLVQTNLRKSLIIIWPGGTYAVILILIINNKIKTLIMLLHSVVEEQWVLYPLARHALAQKKKKRMRWIEEEYVRKSIITSACWTYERTIVANVTKTLYIAWIQNYT